MSIVNYEWFVCGNGSAGVPWERGQPSNGDRISLTWGTMNSYGTTLVGNVLNRVPEEASGPHGGVDAAGQEFELPVARPPESRSSRPRPASMPPQPYHPSPVLPPPEPATVRRSIDDSRGLGEPVQKTSRSSKMLGDYTLGKTLGQGSMGKVKLAQHNGTGEKVRLSVVNVVGVVSESLGSLLSKSCHGRSTR